MGNSKTSNKLSSSGGDEWANSGVKSLPHHYALVCWFACVIILGSSLWMYKELWTAVPASDSFMYPLRVKSCCAAEWPDEENKKMAGTQDGCPRVLSENSQLCDRILQYLTLTCLKSSVAYQSLNFGFTSFKRDRYSQKLSELTYLKTSWSPWSSRYPKK